MLTLGPIWEPILDPIFDTLAFPPPSPPGSREQLPSRRQPAKGLSTPLWSHLSRFLDPIFDALAFPPTLSPSPLRDPGNCLSQP